MHTGFCAHKSLLILTFRIFPLIFYVLFRSVHAVLQDLFYKVVGYPEQALQGELALVTGGGGGLGRLLALRLSKLGVDIVIWDINQEGTCSTYCIHQTLSHSYSCYVSSECRGLRPFVEIMAILYVRTTSALRQTHKAAQPTMLWIVCDMKSTMNTTTICTHFAWIYGQSDGNYCRNFWTPAERDRNVSYILTANTRYYAIVIGWVPWAAVISSTLDSCGIAANY